MTPQKEKAVGEFYSWAVTGPDGVVKSGHRSCRDLAGRSAQEFADWSMWSLKVEPGETVHVWVGCVDARPGRALDGLRPADATAVMS